ncbi:MAG: hypothetical protein OXH34_07740, partial [Bacteroidetes bacterium]|nr:hypothetical protein [Bacteroidota bacterium]
MSNESRYILNGIQTRLQGCWNRLITERVAIGLVLLIITAASGLALLLMVEMRFWMPTSWRSIFFWGWVIGAVALLFWLVIRPWISGWIRRSQYKSIARTVAQEQPALQNRLVSLLELCNGDASPAPQPLVDHAVQSLDAEVSKLPLVERVNWRQPIAWSRYAVIPLGLIAMLVLAAPQGFRDASVRLFSPGTTF